MTNKHLNRTLNRKISDDEYYTLYEDVCAELDHYDFTGKRVYCCYDDPKKSMFTRYFIKKREIANCISTHTLYPDLLDLCDVVVTNPPFSQLKNFVKMLMFWGSEFRDEFDPKLQFLILAPITALGTKIVKKGIYTGFIHCEHNHGCFSFLRPSGKTESIGCCWLVGGMKVCRQAKLSDPHFTQVTYDSGIYRRYDQYNAIEVPSIDRIPSDYDGVMGVPITYLLVHNPRKYDIKNVSYPRKLTINNCEVFARVLIQRKSD